MKKGVKIGIVVLVCAVLLSVVSLYAVPHLKVSLFVHTYHEDIEEGLREGHGVPADETLLLGYRTVNSWDGAHPMTEFILLSWGNTCYGCYYSPDDVPLAFQNADVELIATGEHRWEWKADGDNHGETYKIREGWYFFKTSF